MNPILKFHKSAQVELKGNHFQTQFSTLLLILLLSISSAALILSIWVINIPVIVVPAMSICFFLLAVAIPITVSYEQMMLEFSRGRHESLLSFAFEILGERFARNIALPWIKWLIICPLLFLFVVPGVIRSYDYSLAYYISYDHPQMSSLNCLRQSKKMMKGHKLQLFLLDVTFWPLIILSVATVFLGFVPLRPYYSCAHAKFYDWLKNNAVTDEQK